MSECMVGVDGGGTHTRAIAFTRPGEILGRGGAGPSNWQAVGRDVAVANVRMAVRAAAGEARVLGVGACLAGLDLPEDVARFKPLEDVLGCPVVLENDIAAAAYAEPGAACAVVSAGTGAAVAVRSGDALHRLLALNDYTGPQGGAADIAADAVRAAILAGQGAGPDTELLPRILGAFGLRDVVELARQTQGAAETWRIALVVAPLAAELAARGDAVARAIVRGQGAALGRTAGRFFRVQGLPQDAPVLLYGALLQGGPKPYGEALRRAVHRELPGAGIRTGRVPAAMGAAIFTAERLGWGGAALWAALRRAPDGGAGTRPPRAACGPAGRASAEDL